eukprot:CAMPEP_0202492918 /NCGR_PEP_ID=MMETSP1361-20130828/9449_1 /ASSEMBLY_ACC=CAM_ASM_000849 /TAXON_ID=210615 /ORGANISM="Staurosira complex sp., Strain CCMP2646" /LENGTH=39 /DNA_ID= /DNA_START= /DNA_END= /DNA_ORIENTATION=
MATLRTPARRRIEYVGVVSSSVSSAVAAVEKFSTTKRLG